VQNQQDGADKFVEVLGMKEITMETLMRDRQKGDESVEDIMNRDSNFIKTQEGYPLFFREAADSLSQVKFNTLAPGTGLLDFYESLSTIHWIYKAI